MRTFIGIAAFLTVGVGTVGVGATLSLRGSDTLKDLTINLLTDNTTADGNAALDCGGVNQAATGTLVYEGTGSGNGQAGMLAGTQAVAPMSSAFNTAVCGAVTAGGGLTTAEGIAFALDGVSLVAPKSTDPILCSGTAQLTAADCKNDATPAGLAFSGTLPTTGYVLGTGTSTSAAAITNAADAWKDVLRLIYFGQDHDGNQDCTSAVRRELVNGYKKLLQNQTSGGTACAVGNSCTQLRHAFRRNDESGTTDVFIKSITTLAISQLNNSSPFCNVGTTGPKVTTTPSKACTVNADCNNAGFTTGRCSTTGTATTNPDFHTCDRIPCSADSDCSGAAGSCSVPIGGHNFCNFENITTPRTDVPGHFSGFTADTASRLAPAPRPFSISIASGNGVPSYTYRGGFVDLQDADPIRTNCGFAAGSPTEDVCNRDGKLGLVLPIWDVNLAVSAPVAYPSQQCDNGVFTCVDATPFVSVPGDLCPDGTDPNAAPGINTCPPGLCTIAAKNVLDPVTHAVIGQDPQCLNVSRTNVPAEISSGPFSGGGLSYNLIEWSGTTVGGGTPTIVTEPRATGQFGIPNTVLGPTRQVPMVGAFYRLHSRHGIAAGTLCNDVTVPSRGATDTISCLVQASPCSIGYAGNSAVKGNTIAMNVNNTAPSDACIQKLLDSATPPAETYKLSRKLYLNSVAGFQTLTGHAAGSDLDNEYKLAKCFGDPTIAEARAKTNFDFVLLGQHPAVGDGGAPTPRVPFCVDWANSVCGSAAGACTTNPAGIPNVGPTFP